MLERSMIYFLKATVILSTVLIMSPAQATDRNVALILDASGSMNGKLADGTRKINAAKTAVRDLVSGLPDDIRLSFRAYGHQFHRSKHNCNDTQLLVPLANVHSVRSSVISSSDELTAQGYTPITHVLGLAADDLKPQTGLRTIVLVSDGKETCEGDPCLLAKKLADADASLTIHTVGLAVDAQARLQLQCIADVARGTYYDAGSAVELSRIMETAIETAPLDISDETITLTLPKEQTGQLTVINPYFNKIMDPETGEKITTLTGDNPTGTLPVGIYNVSFGKSQWLKSVAVLANKTTTITPGRLRIEQPYFNEVRDPETGESVEKATESHSEFPLLAGRYDVTFGKAIWRDVIVKEGELTVLTPGRLRVENAYFNNILDPETGETLLRLNGADDEKPLPPGTYDVQFGKKLWRGVTVKKGETTTLTPARFRMEKPYFNRIIDQETGQEVEKLTENRDVLQLPPGTYAIMFGKVAWKNFSVASGDEIVVNPGRIKIDGKGFFYKVFNETGDEVIKLTEGTNDVPLPPGKYTLDVDGQIFLVTLTEGKRLVLKIQ